MFNITLQKGNEDDKNGDCDENSLWRSVELYYYVPDPNNENYIQSTSFSYLNLRSDANVEFADNVFEMVPKFDFTSKNNNSLKDSAEFEALINNILEYDREYNKKLQKFTKPFSDNSAEKPNKVIKK